MMNSADIMKPKLVKMIKPNTREAAGPCCADSDAWAYGKVLDGYIDAVNRPMVKN
ncbi:MAG: hypothetical protein ACI9E1_001724 [Cryomorphaceae bacterium]|jgi:hypothetical protein